MWSVDSHESSKARESGLVPCVTGRHCPIHVQACRSLSCSQVSQWRGLIPWCVRNTVNEPQNPIDVSLCTSNQRQCFFCFTPNQHHPPVTSQITVLFSHSKSAPATDSRTELLAVRIYCPCTVIDQPGQSKIAVCLAVCRGHQVNCGEKKNLCLVSSRITIDLCFWGVAYWGGVWSGIFASVMVHTRITRSMTCVRLVGPGRNR